MSLLHCQTDCYPWKYYTLSYFADGGLHEQYSIEPFACSQELPYDYDSIMHYESFACSANRRPTILIRTQDASQTKIIPEQHRPTEYDFLHIFNFLRTAMVSKLLTYAYT